MEKRKIVIILLLLSSLMGYLEWGNKQHLFLFQAEIELFKKGITNPISILHPFIVLPFLGQVLLLLSLFQNKFHKWFTLGGILCIGLLMIMLLFVGMISRNYKIVLGSLPFLICSYFVIKNLKK